MRVIALASCGGCRSSSLLLGWLGLSGINFLLFGFWSFLLFLLGLRRCGIFSLLGFRFLLSSLCLGFGLGLGWFLLLVLRLINLCLFNFLWLFLSPRLLLLWLLRRGLLLLWGYLILDLLFDSFKHPYRLLLLLLLSSDFLLLLFLHWSRL